MAVKIKGITKNSYAEKAEIHADETLISINGNTIIDVLDYRFHQLNRNLKLVIQDKFSKERTVTITKKEYDEIGLEFETYLMDEKHSCKNKCIFCFIDQLPKNMRETLYFKDDDSRLSFLFGNYITLTNLSEHEISRIIKMHISPINVSVHTTNPELRKKMMNNRFAGEVLSILTRFAEAGIKINCQIVSCPGINDGNELRRTLDDLEKLYPSLQMIAVVPVGLTAHREGLYKLESYNEQTALETLKIIDEYGDKFLKKYNSRIVFAADEFYIKANREIPNAEFYENFEQLENGVGLLALMKEEFELALSDYQDVQINTNRKVTIASGTSASPYLRKLFDLAENQYKGLEIQSVPIKNNFFGGEVNVSGLVVGTDLIEQLKNKSLGDELLIPSVMLRHEGDIFLDDVSLDDVKKTLNINVTPVDNDGEKLLKAILGIK